MEMHANSVLGYLNTMVEFRETSKGLHKPKDYRFGSVEELVRHYGKEFKEEKRLFHNGGEEKACYRNASLEMWRDETLNYVEGFANVVIPVQHAWVVDNDGNWFDPTWGDDRGEDYFGIELNREWAMDFTAKTGYFGIMTEFYLNPVQDLLKNGFPDGAVVWPKA